MGAPEKDACTDALGSKSYYEECKTAEDEEEDAVGEGMAAENEEEGAADDEDEDIDLSTLLESVVTAVGTEAKYSSRCERSGCARSYKEPHRREPRAWSAGLVRRMPMRLL